MFIRVWSEDFETGIEQIDLQHKELFELINLFSFRAEKGVEIHDIIDFVDNLLNYAIAHFGLEEKWMQEKRYPLLDYHINIHNTLKFQLEQVKQQLKENTIENPAQTVLDFGASWLNNHIAKDDLTFFDFCNHKNLVLGKELEGCKCEIAAMNNALLGVGTVEHIDEEQLIIANNGQTPIRVRTNDIVKITLTTPSGLQVLVAKVYVSTPEQLKLFNATLVKARNEREFVRVPVHIETTLYQRQQPIPVIISDISVGGLLILTQQTLIPGEHVGLEFTILNCQFQVTCRVMRAVKGNTDTNAYGLKFRNMTNSQLDQIAEYVFHKQCEMRQTIKN